MSKKDYRNTDKLSLLGYIISLHNKYLLYGRLGSLLGLVILPMFYYIDMVLTAYPINTLYYRLLPWIVSLIILIISFIILKENQKLVFILYICVIFSSYLTLLLIIYCNFNRGHVNYDSQLINSLIIVVFMIYLFSPDLKRILNILISLVLININIVSLVLGYLFNPSLIIKALSILGIITENNELKAYINREKLLMSQVSLRKKIENRLKNEISLEKDLYMDNMTGVLNRNAEEKNLIYSLNTY